MAREWEQANAWQRGLRRLAASGPGSAVFSRVLDPLDRLTFRATRGSHLASIIGSNYGKPKHPAWRHNLRANPEGVVDVEGERWAFRADEIEDGRREDVWETALRTYPGFSAYAKRAAPRRISVFILHRA